ncbi:MAG: class I SAM-dependent methyltransferase [Candidatus Odinarchaeota archaeon]
MAQSPSWRRPLIRLFITSKLGIQIRRFPLLQRLKLIYPVKLIWNRFKEIGDTEAPIFWTGSGSRLRELAYGISAEDAWKSAGIEWVQDYILLGLQSEQHRDWHVVEIGCGPGRMLAEMATMFELVTGVDFSPDMVKYTRSRFRHLNNVKILLNDGKAIPMKTASVDLVYSVLALQHMNREAVESYFSEASRVLRPSGIFRFQTRWDIEQRNANYMDRYFLSKQDVQDLAKHNGFEIIDYQHGLAHELFHWFTLRKVNEE